MSTTQYNVVTGIVMACAIITYILHVSFGLKMRYLLSVLAMAYVIMAASSVVYSISRI